MNEPADLPGGAGGMQRRGYMEAVFPPGMATQGRRRGMW